MRRKQLNYLVLMSLQIRCSVFHFLSSYLSLPNTMYGFIDRDKVIESIWSDSIRFAGHLSATFLQFAAPLCKLLPTKNYLPMSSYKTALMSENKMGPLWRQFCKCLQRVWQERFEWIMPMIRGYPSVRNNKSPAWHLTFQCPFRITRV